jgi:hypothetical protein
VALLVIGIREVKEIESEVWRSLESGDPGAPDVVVKMHEGFCLSIENSRPETFSKKFKRVCGLAV